MKATFPRICLGAAGAAALLVAGCGGSGSAASDATAMPATPMSATVTAQGELPPFNFAIQTLSNRADLISDGDALVQVTAPKTVPMKKVTLTLNGIDVTASFVADETARTFRGVLTGLAVGANTFIADSNGNGNGRPWASLTITNHVRGGPILLGSQAGPWICATPTPVAASGNTPGSNASGLTTFAVDAQCNIATEFKLFYRTTTTGCSTGLPDPSPPAAPPANNCFKPYAVGTTPADLATTTTTDGRTVPYIVRVERGTMNRGIYDIAVLFDPTRGWSALQPQPQWNGKVLYSFGASTGQPRQQFRTEQNWADNTALSRGFMVVDNSVTDSLYNSNRVLVAETVMMMKEHIVDTYGEVKYTLGNGCSGGSIQQNTVSSIYPGLLDGIQPSCDFSDSITTGLEVTDCVLLVNAYQTPEWLALQSGLTQAQINAKKTAINGHLDQSGCQSWNNSFGFNNKPGNYVPVLVINPTTGALAPIGAPRNNCNLPAALVYDPLTNPTGTRCGDPDLAAAVWGTTAGIAPGSTRALQTGDNVGIQYGLKALQSGAITAEDFVTLNEKIGGVDADSNRTAARSSADLAALGIAYRAGILSSGTNLGKLPIIDSRGWDEQGIHYIWRSFSERARIDAANGQHGNQVMWRYGTGLLPATAAQVAAVTTQSFLQMDLWLSNLLISSPKATLNSVRTQADVIAAKPATTFDLCYLTGDTNFTTPVTDFTVCDADPRLPKHASPRQVAGGALTENILKCQLKPLDPADYAPAALSNPQLARLNAVFPGGVCDWSKPGVGQQEAISPLTFAAGPGGQPLPPAPTQMTRVH
ncbi:MAG TPA: DUF6351 family protein [Caldimonas sp.]|nr:DUF6351 family protein [Caldimonas sp.]HEX4235770.1 DUF6351 family protein [Caldimonas sp.]